MEKKILEGKYNKLLRDEKFDKLELGLQNPNIFEILRISKAEIRHSNFLVWLLKPNGSHKLGDIFLKRFLREVFLSNKFPGIDQVDVEGMDLSKVEVHREWKHIDILIKLENVVVCIENKVWSGEHSNQLTRYKKIVDEEFPDHTKTGVYLSPDGAVPINEAEFYEPMAYDFIVESLENIISVYGKSLNEQVQNYINDYITAIKRNLMGTDQSIKLARKIYKNHKELFDFINNNKSDIGEVREIIKKEVRKRGWVLGSQSKHQVRFHTPQMKELTYYSKEKHSDNDWKERESFLFIIETTPSTGNILFFTCIAPCDSQYDRKRLEDILCEIGKIEGFTKSENAIWLINFEEAQKFNYDNIPSMTEEEIRNLVNEFLDNIAPTVEKVEQKFLERQAELLEMKNV